MKKLITIIIHIAHTFVITSQEVKIKPPAIFFELANSVNLELVYGYKFPYLDIMGEGGNYGSPIIEGFLKTEKKIWIDKSKNIFRFETIPYYLFICREKKKEHQQYKKRDSFYRQYHYYNSFNYYLVFAVNKDNDYQIKKVYKWGSTGMSKYLWNMRKEWDKFSKLLSKKDSIEDSYVYRSKNSIKIEEIENDSPIITSTNMGYSVLVYYNNDWYIHTVQYE